MGRAARSILIPLVAVSLVTACGDGGTAPASVASIQLDPTGPIELQLGDSVRVVATARDASGNVVSDRPVTWTSSDAGVAQVGAGGLITGVGAGSATITASGDAASSSVSVTVDDYNIAAGTVVMDSTHLALLSDSAERAAGTYRFQILQGTAPDLQPGSVIVGTQGGGFLRKVTSSGVAGGIVTLATEAAALTDVLEEGSMQDTVDLLFAPGTTPSRAGGLRPGRVVWGPPVITYLAPDVAMTATGFDLTGADLCALAKKLPGGVACPKGLKLLVKDGSLDFDPRLDLGFHISKKALQSFHAIAEGDLLLDFDLEMDAKTSGTVFQPEGTLLEFKRPFWFQVGWLPVAGVIEGKLDLAADVSATAQGSIQAGFTDQHTVRAGASYSRNGGWTPVLDHTELFSGREPQLGDSTLTGKIEVTTKVALKPDLQVLFYAVAGPYVAVSPYGEVTLTFGTQQCDLKSEAGVDLDFGFTVAILDPKVGTFGKQIEPWFKWDGTPWTCPLGTLDVATITNGSDPDPDGYTVVVDTTHEIAIGANDQQTVKFIPVGERQVELDGVASNCSVDGGQPRAVTVSTGVVTPVQFNVQCDPLQGPYFNDFNARSAPLWSPSTVTTSPSGEPFLGAPFGNDSASLTLHDLPDHTEVEIELDFYALKTLDGNQRLNEGQVIGPDVITFSLDDSTLKTTTFSNNTAMQAYPGDYPDASNPAATGAVSVNTLGYPSDAITLSDADYHITFTVPHTASSLVFSVAGSGQQGWPNEGWGIDNVRVTVH